MICSCCEKEIKEDEKFYEIDNEFYCDDCVEEKTITYYELENGEKYEENDVCCYRNTSGYINDIKVQIDYYQKDLDYYSKRSDEFSIKRTKQLRVVIRELEYQLRIVLLGDDGE
ncbi:hypothetical protein FUSNEC_GEN_294_01455 [Fusobacterium necrophorum subsp. funduliforme]|uniref:hypothetical protein n=1 Tax=Fusobacterium necrophorum TaxID=859 RepID=UPI000786C43F|nr:hypothetical protein [Fusobacterium necrophorum]AYV94345.1 hypothetical protein BWX37_01395 [Fusobacterium necrophorum subsp. funduliforme]KYL04306.1 hypothetical protein A2J06_01490 [Fusobacterium necrophorum subsp. funduliforme]KYM51141.1 hypothetical protein A2U04_02005 [Fusobacterium necrophorum subsp. funduliforme]MDK4472398.1 hypothetical protein [Fusobacterium necrophorum]MDK4479171.1 hypothetical protein [Fusobacterium necrophorum]